MGRVHRMGQTREVHVRKLIMRDSLEGRILKVQRKKQNGGQSYGGGGSGSGDRKGAAKAGSGGGEEKEVTMGVHSQ